MSISFSLLAKTIGGVTAVATPVTLSVVYRDNITELFSSKETLSEEEIEGDWNFEKINDQDKFKISYPKKECVVSVTKINTSETIDIQTIINKLEESLKKTTGLTDTEKQNRRNVLNKCKSNNYEFNISISSSEITDSSDLLSKLLEKTLNNEEQGLASTTWQFTTETAENKITTTVTASSQTNDKISVGTCKIIGSAESGKTIEKSKLDSVKEKIEKSIKDQIENQSKTENRKKFLTKCKNSSNNEINFQLKTKENQTEEYELENLSSIFTISN